MAGAAELCAHGAYRAGAGMVRLGIPGGRPGAAAGGRGGGHRARCRPRVGRRRARPWPSAVGLWWSGPGLGRARGTADEVRALVAAVGRSPSWSTPTASSPSARATTSACGALRRRRPEVPTPSSPRTTGSSPAWPGRPPGADRIAAARRAGRAARGRGAAEGPDHRGGRARRATALLVTAGSPRLATAGTGDVLAGAIGAFVARGLAPFEAAALAAHVHGRAAALGPPEGLVAGDLADLVARWLSGVRRG